MRRALPALAVTLALSAGALAQPKAVTGPAFEQDTYGKMPPVKDKNGKEVPGPVVTRYTLVNKNGKALDNLSVVATLYDSKGNVTGFRQVNLPANQSLASGSSLPFSLDVIPQGMGTTHIEVSAEGLGQ